MSGDSSEKPWLKALLTPPASSTRQDNCTINDLLGEFSEQVAELFGIPVDNDELNYTEVPNISKERYGRILEGEDADIASDDAVDYDEDSQTLIVAPYFLKHALREWANQQLPRLFKTEYPLKIDGSLVNELEVNLMMILKNYQMLRIIDNNIQLPETNRAIHDQLESIFDKTLKLYSAPSQPPKSL